MTSLLLKNTEARWMSNSDHFRKKIYNEDTCQRQCYRPSVAGNCQCVTVQAKPLSADEYAKITPQPVATLVHQGKGTKHPI